jgi:hypothetical protein
VSLQWSIQPTERAALAAQAVQTTCGEPTPGLSPFPIIERLAKQQHTWIALRPGQYTEVQDTLSTSGISDVAGKYEVRAVYTAPNFTPEQKQDLRAGEIETPKGQYRSDAVKFAVPE